MHIAKDEKIKTDMSEFVFWGEYTSRTARTNVQLLKRKKSEQIESTVHNCFNQTISNFPRVVNL